MGREGGGVKWRERGEGGKGENERKGGRKRQKEQ